MAASASPGLARVDLIAFILGLASYAELMTKEGSGASEAVFKAGKALCLRSNITEVLHPMLADMQRSFESEMSQPMVLLSTMEQASRMIGTKKFGYLGLKLPVILNWFQTHLDNFQDILPGPAKSSIQALIQLGDTNDPIQRLKALGTFGFRSTIRALRKWIMEEALPSLQLAPTGVAATVADIKAVQPYVEELQDVKQQIAAMDPSSEEAAELSETRVILQEQIEELVDESANPGAVESAVSSELALDPLAKIAQKYRLDEDQAAVVASKGSVVVSAGAGSGKTTTLIAVVQHSLDNGYRADQILGTTFTKKASKEFNERLGAKGVTGVRFGTTHSIAGEIIRTAAPELAHMLDKPERADKLFEMAIKQVGMRPSSTVPPPDLTEAPIEPEQEVSENSAIAHLARVRAALKKHDPGRRWATILMDFESSLMRPNARPLSENQLRTVVKFENTPPGGFQRRRGSEEDMFPSFQVHAGVEDKAKTKLWREPANMWWNLGISLKERKKGLRSRVGRWQNGGKSWQSIWKQYGRLPPPSADDMTALYESAAVYAAYSWLKQNDPQYGPVLDFDDWLSKAVELLIRKPKFLESLQQKCKVLIVDEAQDLNNLQWQLFGMLSKKTERYLLVGDDFQAIYAFRGASTDQFISKPDEGFELKQMGINYRSGSNIVETANQLIAKNENQIKKSCRAARNNGKGSIEARIVPTHADVAQETAASIANLIQGGAKASDFGIAVRNNAEMDAFCLALMTRKIPFICKRDPLEGPIPKVTLSWFTLAEAENLSRDEVNDAIAVAHQNPGFFLDQVFIANLRAAVPKGSDQLTVLLDDFQAYGGNQSHRNRNVRAYAEAIRSIQNFAKSDDLLRAILAIRGQNGDTFGQRLLDEIDSEDVDPSLTGEARDAAIKDAAELPLKPLFQIAEEIPSPVEYITFINKMRRAQAALKKGQKDESDEPAVRIGTAHGWKGLECEHMYVCMANGVFPNPMSEDGVEEERRLAYVAVTRGKKTVTVFSPLESYRGPPRTPPGVPPPPPRPSQFVDEMEGGCMPVFGRELLGGLAGGRPSLSEDEAEAEIQELEEANAAGDEEPIKFARRLVASLETPLQMDPLDPHWGDLV